MKNITSRRWIAARAACALAIAALAGAGSVRAGTLAVTSLNDSGPGSLREAVTSALSGDTITFSVTGTITLTSGALTIDKSLNIQGPGPNKLTVSGNHVSRVFVVLEEASVALEGFTVANGLVDGSTQPEPGFGGGILNAGNLTLSNVIVSGNQVFGHPSVSPNNYPGAAGGGGIANAGNMVVTGCSFVDNLARAGDGSSTSVFPVLAGLAYGAGIYNEGDLTVTGSTFSHNQSIGGSYCFSPVLSGHGSGGAIGSTLQGVLVVSESSFHHNQAIAGDGNSTWPVPTGLGPNKATAGAINIGGGEAAIEGCTFEHNQAMGGSGGMGSGGGIVVTDVSGFGVNATIRNCTVLHNKALGGPGQAGGSGGDGTGGGIACIAGATLTVINCTVEHNHAQGGEADAGGQTGNGLGGGVYEDAGVFAPSTLALENTFVRFNLALGGGSDGQGIGGGVYWLGVYSADSTTVIEKNHASTIDDNVWP